MNAITTSFINQLEDIEKSVDEIIIYLFGLLTNKQKGNLLVTLQHILKTDYFIRVLSFRADLSKVNMVDKLKVLNLIERIIIKDNGN
jgi:hypothetical protein